ncbi:MAG: hypothetical protein KAJ78_08840, partial [Acidobacteria bacterium]|nr:hypothetical protein [Acidobacteriota bacterium]
MFAHVAIPRSAPAPLVYAVPETFADAVKPGIRVRVPLRRRQTTGIVIEVSETSGIESSSIREILEVLDDRPLLPDHIFALARFISSYYRCPLGTTLATMLPAGLLRADTEKAEPTPRGAAADLQGLPEKQRAILTTLLEHRKLPVAGVLARAGAGSRTPLDALELAGLVRLSRTRRDRLPRSEVGAVALPPEPIDDLLERCGRAPRQREVLSWLADRDGPALESEVCTTLGCTASVIRALETKGLVLR